MIRYRVKLFIEGAERVYWWCWAKCYFNIIFTYWIIAWL